MQTKLGKLPSDWKYLNFSKSLDKKAAKFVVFFLLFLNNKLF